MYKAIESISTGKNTTKLKNNFHSVERHPGDARETFFLPESNSMLYTADHFSGELLLTLDCRRIYDFDDKGRIYKTEISKDYAVIEYTKHSDDTLKEKSYTVYTAIKWKGIEKKDITEVSKWKKKHYETDAKRNSTPFDLYIYDALKISCNEKSGIHGDKHKVMLFFGFSESKEEALKRAEDLYTHYVKETQKMMLRKSHHYSTKLSMKKIHNQNIQDKELQAAYACSLNSLDWLNNSAAGINGYYAGLPWFFQFWSRDEAISLGALIREHRFEEAKKILERLLSKIDSKGRIPNRFPISELSSADAAGWAFKRLMELIEQLENEKKLDKYFTKAELHYFLSRTELSIKNTLNTCENEELIHNNALETWMDTSFQNDTREGKRIEIQCLFLSTLSTAVYLSGLLGEKKREEHYFNLEKEFSERVKAMFFDEKKKILLDGAEDSTQRPNVFISYYLYPNLLPKEEWKNVFSNALDKLWLEWGGLSTIEKTSPLFCPDYTGQDNKSYHRGDSWFFVNNIAAISMFRLDSKKFLEQISSIIKASADEILFSGAISHSSELSSASSMKSEGCAVQAWSASTFTELMHEVFEK